MLRKLKFNKIDENYVSEYEIKVLNSTTNEVIKIETIDNVNNGPTLHVKSLDYKENNIYFIDEHIYYSEFYDIAVYVDDKLINNTNIEYNPLTKCFFLNNVNNINHYSNIVVKYYKNIIEYDIDIPENSKVVITPILYKKHYVGNHNVLY